MLPLASLQSASVKLCGLLTQLAQPTVNFKTRPRSPTKHHSDLSHSLSLSLIKFQAALTWTGMKRDGRWGWGLSQPSSTLKPLCKAT